MPLNAKGEKILKSMEETYGAEKAEHVLYASKNAGKISGIDEQAAADSDRERSNAYNSGLVHLGKRGAGTDPACGRNAHSTYAFEKFLTFGSESRCKRCSETAEKWQQMKAKREARTDDAVIKGAGILFISPTRNALFLRRSATAHDCPGCWDFPGGVIEPGETAEECAVREAKEEIGSLPKGERKFHTRQRPSAGLAAGIGAPPVLLLPVQDAGVPSAAGSTPPPAPPPPLAPAPPAPTSDVIADFTTFIQEVAEEFEPTLDDEHDGWAWAPISGPPEPLHPGCQIALDRITMDELGVARAIAAGQLTSPQRYENVTLWAIRITGTDVAFRNKHDEFVYRKPENYLTAEFLARCAGLPVVFKHPKKAILDSEEFGNRIVGTIFLPYIAGSEVWGIAKVYDAAANQAMDRETLSTSPGVNFADFSVNARLRLEDGAKVLIEGMPSSIDHVAVVELGVWDKGGEPAGIRSETSREDSQMNDKTSAAELARADDAAKKDNVETKRDDADAGKALAKTIGDAIADGFGKMHSRLDELFTRKDAAKKDDDDKDKEKDKERDDAARKDAKRKDEVEDKEKGDPEKLAADKSKKDAAEEEEKKEDKKPPFMDKAKKDEAEDKDKDKDRKDARADSAALRSRIEEVAGMVKPLADDEHHLLADAYTRADDVFSAMGKTTPRPIPGETAALYRRRVTRALKEHSPTWKKVDLSSQAFADDAAFGIAEAQILTEAMSAARSPATVQPGQLRMVERKRDGHIVREFIGEPRTWMDPMAGATQLRATGAFLTPNAPRSN